MLTRRLFVFGALAALLPAIDAEARGGGRGGGRSGGKRSGGGRSKIAKVPRAVPAPKKASDSAQSDQSNRGNADGCGSRGGLATGNPTASARAGKIDPIWCVVTNHPLNRP